MTEYIRQKKAIDSVFDIRSRTPANKTRYDLCAGRILRRKGIRADSMAQIIDRCCLKPKFRGTRA